MYHVGTWNVSRGLGKCGAEGTEMGEIFFWEVYCACPTGPGACGSICMP
jgi:hypothetical protein